MQNKPEPTLLTTETQELSKDVVTKVQQETVAGTRIVHAIVREIQSGEWCGWGDAEDHCDYADRAPDPD